MYQYRMFFVHTCMHQKLANMICITTNALTKSHVELEDNSTVSKICEV